MKQALAAWVVS